MKTLPALVAVCIVGATSVAFAEAPSLTGEAARLYDQSRTSKWFSHAEKLKPQIVPTSDGRSFCVIWKSSPKPKHWLVSLHGSGGFAMDDLAIWHQHLKGRDVGVVCVQWWLGTDERNGYLTPPQVYREIDMTLQKLGVTPGTVMFHGFSRGSANSYAIAALDQGRGKKYFTLNVASSGGVGLDYPPTRAIAAGEYGSRPLEGTRWITSAGARDPEPQRDGIEGMRKTSVWLKGQGATVVMSIEDPSAGHGALVTNAKNTKRVLDQFLSGR